MNDLNIPTTPEGVEAAVEAYGMMKTLCEDRGLFSGRYIAGHAITPDALRHLLESHAKATALEARVAALEGENNKFRRAIQDVINKAENQMDILLDGEEEAEGWENMTADDRDSYENWKEQRDELRTLLSAGEGA